MSLALSASCVRYERLSRLQFGLNRNQSFEWLGHDAAGRHGQGAGSCAGGLENGGGEGGSDGDDRSFAGADGCEIGSVDEHRFELRCITKAGHAVVGKASIFDLAASKLNFLEQGSADSL